MLISVVIPMYNASKHIEDMLESVVNQKYKNMEIIIVNDGSIDDSETKARKYLENKKVEFKIINKENEGQSKARNIGIRESKGDYIVLVDADDYLNDEYIRSMAEAIKTSAADVVVCDIKYVKQTNIKKMDTRDLGNKEYTGKEVFKMFIMHEITVGPCSLFINRKYLESQDLLFNENSRYSEEYIFITRLLFNSKKVIHVRKKLYNYCIRKGSVSTSSKIDVILNGFNKIKEASNIYINENDEYCKIYNRYAHARWILATCRWSSKYFNYKDYKILMKKLNAKEELKKIYDFPDRKTRIAAKVYCTSELLAYVLFKVV